MTELADLEPGKTYRVALDDCCVEGHFTSRLDAVAFDEGYLDSLAFANGVVLTTARQVTFTEQAAHAALLKAGQSLISAARSIEAEGPG